MQVSSKVMGRKKMECTLWPVITCASNTDKEIWRRILDDYHSPSIHVTENGDIGINVGGYILVAPIEKWHEAGVKAFTVKWPLHGWKKIIHKVKSILFRRHYLKKSYNNYFVVEPIQRTGKPAADL